MNFLEKQQWSMKQLKQEITRDNGTKSKPMYGCKIRWYGDVMGQIKGMKSCVTEEQYRKLTHWAL